MAPGGHDQRNTQGGGRGSKWLAKAKGALSKAASIIGNIIATLAALALLVVPFVVPTWFLTVQVIPEASLLQQMFVFALIAAALLLTVSGAFLMWVIGCFFIGVWILLQIWQFLA